MAEFTLHHPSFLKGLEVGRRLKNKRLRKPVAYLYNGVRFPELPEWDKETYPYVVIMQTATSSSPEYIAQAITAPLYTKTTLSIQSKPIFQLAYEQRYLLKMSANELGAWKSWTKLPSAYFTGRLTYDGTVENVLVWSNHDILNEDGTVYLEASEPVPIYE